jgi:3-dehydroquinate dehydratase-2
MNLLVLHGPNLNLLGEREPEIYGRLSLKEINIQIKKFAVKNKSLARILQFNGEGQIIDALHKNRKWSHGIVINPGAYTHYSYAIRDAIASINRPTVEVHLSDIQKREEFRKISVIAPVCTGQVSGLGLNSYIEGMKLLLERAKNARKYHWANF